MKPVLLSIIMLATSVLAHAGYLVEAKGFVSISQEEGPIGTVVELSSTHWTPNIEVRIMARWAASPRDSHAPMVGPIATTHSDQGGRWGVALDVASGGGLDVPPRPGIVSYVAVSDGRVQTDGDEVVFVVIVDGARPNGAGGVRLTITVANGPSEALAFLDWQPAGSSTFYVTHLGPISLREPFSTTIGQLSDGDWDILVIVGGSLQPIGTSPIDTIQATLCASPSQPCGASSGPLRVKRVSIRDGGVVDAEIVLGEAGSQAAARLPGTGNAAPTARAGRLLGIAVIAFCGGVLVLAGSIRGERITTPPESAPKARTIGGRCR